MNASTKPNTLAPDTHGAPFEGGFYGGQIRIGAALFAVIWAPKAQGELNGKWLGSYTSVPGACSYFDSMANTQAMGEAGSDLARQALALDINGFTDWCLPARDVLELAYRHLKPTKKENYAHRNGDNPSSAPAGYPYTEAFPTQTRESAFRESGAEAFGGEWYWSSTQYSDGRAWYQFFNYGLQDYDDKSYEARCRAVRLIQLGT